MAQKNETPVLILALLITVGLIGAGIWWFTRQSGLNLGNLTQSGSPTPSGSVSQTGQASPATSEATSSGQPGASFAAIQNVPSGVFNYGGSTSWAPIRGEVDSIIQTVFPNFRLRYTDPLTGVPGSSTGIRMLLDNQLAFSQSSRSLRPEEYQEAQQRGFTLQEIPVALEGIAIAVHPDLNIPGLTIEQLQGIYLGRITNWNQVGGPNLAVVPYSRPMNAGGTVEFFVDNILGGQPFGNSVRLIGTTTEALREVSNNPGGLYYASAPEVIGQCTTKPLAIGRSIDQLVAPYQQPLVPEAQCPAQRNQINPEVLQSGEYPITRRLFVIVKQNGQADQQAGEAYANLLLTDQGQQLLSEAGFVRIR
ncbi:PstS family phosphate ABC transporter substrate-binding protein [Oscillatoria sp. FACHB-1407]|uniref:PstS family phosphate ABC transporter substrate-binding protein n=1 Tax=Oscillatoria sp. FACHB-1407 TaxID=2692847 RepID=UPI001689BEBF|nr:PstS family phosphate ABC transporter substrate-binding protein [Oscillatoria sp. FACHB-1407]MBD2460977.1 PstS family phosphate ABC transporter substrate-binding protein [Oscillatoria sp. FACHB-1407]